MASTSDTGSETVTLAGRRLTKRFGNRVALSEVTVAARAGELVAVIGPNGAGKTTLLAILASVIAPTSGEFTRPADEVEWRLSKRQRLPNDALDEPDAGSYRAAARSELVETPLHPSCVFARLAQVRFEAVTVASARGHRDLRAQQGDDCLLCCVRLAQVLHDLLFGLVHWSPAFSKTVV